MNEGERLKLIKSEKEHYDRIHSEFHKLYHGDPDTDLAQGKIRDRLVRFLLKFISNASKTLDIGCGQGFLTEPLAELRFDIVGLDISNKMCLDAKKRAERKSLKINYVVANALELPFKKDEFDVVICYETLQHIPAPGNAIKEMVRVAKTVIIETRNDHFILEKSHARRDAIDQRFKEHELKAFVNAAGLDHCQIDFRSFEHPLINFLPKLIKRKIVYGIWIIGKK